MATETLGESILICSHDSVSRPVWNLWPQTAMRYRLEIKEEAIYFDHACIYTFHGSYRARFLDGQQLEGVAEQCRFRRTARPRSTPCIMRVYAPFWGSSCSILDARSFREDPAHRPWLNLELELIVLLMCADPEPVSNDRSARERGRGSCDRFRQCKPHLSCGNLETDVADWP